MQKLQNSLKVIVPTKNNDGRPFDYQSLIDSVTKLIGGCTVTNGNGYWFADDGTKYIDTVKVAEFDSSQNDSTDISYIFNKIVRPLMLNYQQLAVTMQVNNVTFILDTHDLVNPDETINTLTRELYSTTTIKKAM